MQALIATVEDLDKIRMLFNATDGLAGQDGAYGKVAGAMQDVLALYFGKSLATEIYRTIIESGVSVSEAIEYVSAENEITAP